MSTEHDRLDLTEASTAPAEDLNRRGFLSQGGHLAGAALAGPALFGLGASVVTPEARAQSLSHARIDSSSPLWTPLLQSLRAARFDKTDSISEIIMRWGPAWVDGVEVVQGTLQVRQRVKWGFQTLQSYTFQFRVFKNTRGKSDLVPDSFLLSNNTAGQIIDLPSHPDDELRRRLADRFDALSELPDRWKQCIARWKTLGFTIHRASIGGAYAGVQRTVYTIKNLNGVFVGAYTIYRTYLAGQWTAIYIPTFSTDMMGARNDLEGALDNAVAVMNALGVATVGGLILLIGRGFAYTESRIDSYDDGSYNQVFGTLIATIAGGVAVSVGVFRRAAIQRASSSFGAVLTMFWQNYLNRKIYLSGDTIPPQDWEIASLSTAPV